MKPVSGRPRGPRDALQVVGVSGGHGGRHRAPARALRSVMCWWFSSSFSSFLVFQLLLRFHDAPETQPLFQKHGVSGADSLQSRRTDCGILRQQLDCGCLRAGGRCGELLNKNTYVRLYPEDAINDSKTRYNQSIITQILSDQLDVLQNNLDKRTVINDRDGLGSYPFTYGLVAQ